MARTRQVTERQDDGPDVARLGAGAIAFGFVPFAAVSDPSSWWLVLVLTLAASGLAAWAFLKVPAEVIGLPVIVLTALSQWEGGLEPGMFLLSLLAIALTGWTDLNWARGLLVLAAVAAPIVIDVLQDEHGLAGGIWVLGVLFPAWMGWAFRRQERLAAELEAARVALAEQALQDERRRIARDVHDMVGHGLAAMMLQVTGARHVLERDPDEARDALDTAEAIGRRALRDLRRTVGTLRDDEGGLQAPLEGLEQVADLVEDARAGGLRTELITRGAQDVDQVIGLTLFRIAQAALALINNPQVVFLDELTQGLDPAARRETWALIRQVRDRGTTVVLVSHYMDEVEQLADRAAVVHGGRVTVCDTPTNLVTRARGEVRTRFTLGPGQHPSRLESLPGVESVSREGPHTEVVGDGTTPVLVAAELARVGILPGDLTVVRPSLEDVFVQLTSGEVAA